MSTGLRYFSSRVPRSPSWKGLAGDARAVPALTPVKGASAPRFLLQHILGVGGVCEVHAALDLYRVEWSDASPRVAVKQLLPEFQHNYQAQLSLAQEFSVLRHLSHPGIVRVFDVHREPQGICYSMELLSGSVLAPVPGGLGAAGYAVAAKLFEILDFLHKGGVSHGDVKPSNVIMEPEGRLVLIDFNTAALTGRSAHGQGLRQRLRLTAHSRLYSSPERIDGDEASPESDVFSACCSVYELLCGKHPFEGLSPLKAVLQDLQPATLADLPGDVWHYLRRGLSMNPRQRPTAHEGRALFARHAEALHDSGLRAALHRLWRWSWPY